MEYTKYKHSAKGTSRLDAFSDGVFAIAITLLVLELIQILYPVTEEGLINTFLHHWQSFLAFTIGFLTILVCWINHHVALEFIEKVDNKFLWINGFLLFVVTLTPFPTAVFAEYLDTEGATAIAIFGFNYVLISIAAYAICIYAYKHHLVKEEDREFFIAFKRIYRYGLIYNVFALLICFVSVVAAIFLYALLFAAFAAPKEFAIILDKRLAKRKRTKSAEVVEQTTSADTDV